MKTGSLRSIVRDRCVPIRLAAGALLALVAGALLVVGGCACAGSVSTSRTHLFANFALSQDNSLLIDFALDPSPAPEPVAPSAVWKTNEAFHRQYDVKPPVPVTLDIAWDRKGVTKHMGTVPVLLTHPASPESEDLVQYESYIKVSIPFNASETASVQHPDDVSFAYFTDKSRPDCAPDGRFACYRTLSFPGGASCQLYVEVRPGITLKTAPVVGFDKGWKVAVQAKPDPAITGNTGMVVDFTVSDWEVKYATFPTTVSITNSDGVQVAKVSSELMKFHFG
jgi:hypothetical protein